MATTLPLHFVLPESHASVSGGNVYNAALLECLVQEHGAQRHSIAKLDSGASAPGIYIIDSLNLSEFQRIESGRVEGQKFVLLVHHLPSLEPELAAEHPDLRLERETLARFDAFLCTSRFTQDYLRSGGYTQPSLVVEPVVARAESVKRPQDRPVQGLMACNLIRRKGVLAFLEGLAASTKADDTYSIDVVGRSDMEPAYAAACRQCIEGARELRGRIRLQGESPYEEMPRWYREANLFVSASRMETFGISLQEARHFGLPILAAGGGNSANHIAPGVTGAVYADPTALALGFIDLVRRPELLRSYQKSACENRPALGPSWVDAADSLVSAIEVWFPCP